MINKAEQSKKKIMILGAGIYQYPLINKAKNMGLYTIVVSIFGNYPGFSIADKKYYVDIVNKEEILKIAKDEKIIAICTSGSDIAVNTIGYVCDKLNLPGNSFTSSQLSTNKLLMKEAFKQNGVNTSPFYKISNYKELEVNFNRLSTSKAVLKIVDMSGSRGIVKVDKNTNWEEVFNKEIEQTRQEYLLLEDFVEGEEIGIDAFVYNGKIQLLVPHRKIIVYVNEIGIPAGHIIDDSFDEAEITNIIKQVELIIKSLKIESGAINIDAIISKDKSIHIIEAGGRAGATGIPEIISEGLGIDYYKLIIDNALGEKININKETKNLSCASMLVFSDKSGILDKYSFVNNFEKDIHLSMDYQIGQKVRKVSNGTDRIGCAIIKAKSDIELQERIQYFKDNFQITVK